MSSARACSPSAFAAPSRTRVSQRCPASEVRVSSTVRDLTVGSGLGFGDAGTRQLKGVPRQAEDRDAIVAFVSSRSGVEAYFEPRTVMHPLSVVLVAGDGEWKRFELADDRFVRELASERRLPVFDASRTGYPDRMRRRTPPPHTQEPGPDGDSG